MPLPKRPGPYLLTLLLIILAVITAWMFKVLAAPEIKQALQKKAKAAAKPSEAGSAVPTVPAQVFIDPVHREMANQLHAADRTAHDDVRLVADFIETYRKALGSNPIGQNEDITAALTGTGGHKGRVFPPNSPAIRDGKLVDRWGTPYWFHPESGSKMEIRSAGPDKDLFTNDDISFKP